MSLLRRLGEQAQQVKEAEAAQERSRQQRKDRYQDLVVPAMQALSVFLSQLTEQLKVVRPTVVHSYELPGYGRFNTVSLLDYTVRSEPRYSDFLIEVAWKSRVDTEKAPRLQLNSFDRIRNISELFKRFHLGGFKDERKGPTGHVIACTVQASGFISSKLSIQGSLEDEHVRFVFDNVDQLLPTRQAIAFELLSDEVCDRLGEFVLRENDTFIRESWMRGLKAPVVPLKPVGYDTPAVKPLNAGPDEGKVPLPSAVITAPAFLGAQMQKSERDHALMAELSEAARLAEAAVLQTMGSAESSHFGSERVLGRVSLTPDPETEAGSSDQPGAAGVRPALATLPVASAATSPAAERFLAVSPAATAPTPSLLTTPAMPISAPPIAADTRAAPTPAIAPSPPIARAPVVATSPAAPPTLAVGSPPAVASTPSLPRVPAPVTATPPMVPARPAVSTPPALGPVSTPASAAAQPSFMDRFAPPPASFPSPAAPAARDAAPAPSGTAPPAAPEPTATAQPAAARGFMDRFKKMRADLERE